MLNFATLVFNSVRSFKVGNHPTYQFHFPTTPGWNDRHNALLQEVNGNDVLFHLEEGTHTFRMENVSGGALNLDYIVFEKVFSDEPSDVTVESIKSFIQSYEHAGAFENPQVVHMLNVHLTSVQVFERQGNEQKVIQHMQGFQILLDHQREQMTISEEAYHALKAETDALIEQWR